MGSRRAAPHPTPPASAPTPRPARALPVLPAALLALLLAACAPQVTTSGVGGTPELRAFSIEPLPFERRWIVAVPNFEVRASSVRVGDVDLTERGESFYTELGSGVADIFVSEAFRSERFRITERAELDKVLLEQDLATTGRVSAETAADVGRITGAELLALGSLSEFGITTTGGGGKVLGFFGGAAETVTARVTVDIRLVDAATAEVMAIGNATSEVSQRNVRVDVFNVIQALQAGRTGTTIVDLAVRNAIRGAIEDAARSLPPKPAG